MHGSQPGALRRRITLAIAVVGCAGAAALAQAPPATAVVVSTGNTITQTAITSPADPSYFYDPTAGALGGITVTGTTNSTNPSSDTVDILCYADNGSTSDPITTPSVLVSGVALNASGGFTTTVPYSAIEVNSYLNDGECRLRAVPSGTEPTTGLSSFSGPRVLVSFLSPAYSATNPSYLFGYTLTAAELGGLEYIVSGGGEFGGCGGLVTMSLASAQYFGAPGDAAFNCAGSFTAPFGSSTGLEVDGVPAQTAADALYQHPVAMTVSASQNPATGAITIQEDEPLYQESSGCSTGGNCTFVSLGVQDDRTFHISDQGRVVLVTDDFVSTNGQPHTVTFDVGATFGPGVQSGGSDLFQLPGQTTFSSYQGGYSFNVGAGVPGTIFGEASPGPVYAAMTYFNAPSGAGTLAASGCVTSTDCPADTPQVPFTLNVPAGGSQSLSVAYAADSQQSALAGELRRELDLVTPPTIAIGSPAAGSFVTSSSVTVSGTVSAATGVASVSVNGVAATVSGASYSATVPLSPGADTLTAVMTTSSGVTASSTETIIYAPLPPPPAVTNQGGAATVTPALQARLHRIWLPIADTGSARRAGRHYERLTGRVTAGNDGVSYYFAYGIGRRLDHRSPVRRLRASHRGRGVMATIGRLMAGRRYRYRLVVFGRLGRSTGRSLTFHALAGSR